MSNRRRLARERLEYYLVYLILMYRFLIMIVGLLLLVYALATIFVNRIAGFSALFPAIFLLLLGNSYNVVVYTARLGAWIGTLWRHDD
jgi:ABC-type multidrug transport system permease subunit